MVRVANIANKHSRHLPLKNPISVAVFIILAVTGLTIALRSNSDFNTSLLEYATTSSSSSSTSSDQQSLATQVVADVGRYPPFSCPELLKQRKLKTILAQDPNLGILYGKETILNPPFYISLHNATFDRTRWKMMSRGEYYETALTKAFEEVLKNSPPGSRVLDVGGNIGYFSLLSASKGSVIIDTFEPNIKNRMRYCESLSFNRWFYTEFDLKPPNLDPTTPIANLYPYGVGREEGTFVFTEHRRNPGQGSFGTRKVVNEDKALAKGTALQVITLDGFAQERGWFESRPNIAILKVDVEGLEYTVIEGAKKLLKAKLIQNVFMEISARNDKEAQPNIPMLEFLSGSGGYKVFKMGSRQGPTTRVDWPNDDKLISRILEATKADRDKQLNLWWTIA